MDARIYRPGKTAMQSGRGGCGVWVLEYEARANRRPESLMGWTSSDNTLAQVRLKFPTLEAAMEYARRSGLNAAVMPGHDRKVKPRNYVDNFRYCPAEEGKAS